MKTVTLSATFDGDHIRLEDDYPLPKNARLLVTLVPSADAEPTSQDGEWRAFALQNLARAYSGDEPEYPDDMLIEHNPLYGKR